MTASALPRASRDTSPSRDPAQVARTHLFGMTPERWVQALSERGVACSLRDARRVLARILSEGDPTRLARAPIARAVRAALDEADYAMPLETLERAEDEADGFVKWLFRAQDGALFEAVQIPLEKPGMYTVCLSSQVGCAMACDFCATGRLGFGRHLYAYEIIASFLAVRAALAPGERLKGAVFMGQGEPLHNYDEVLRAAYILAEPCGGRVAKESVSISTVGLVDKIRRYTAEGHDFRLVISLHSALPERRARLLPVAGRQALPELAAAIREHAAARGERVTVAMTLMRGVNHDQAEVDALRALFDGVPLRLNLIDINDARTADEGGYERLNDDERARFLDALAVLEMPIVRRYSGGKSRHAACGMLANKAVTEAGVSSTAPSAPSEQGAGS